MVQAVGKGLELPEGMKVKMTVEELEVFVEGSSAVAIYHNVFEMVSPQVQARSPQRVSTYFVRKGNSWQILADSFSKCASTIHFWSVLKMTFVSDFLPNSKPKAPTKRDFPAPVSPVKMFIPAWKSMLHSENSA